MISYFVNMRISTKLWLLVQLVTTLSNGVERRRDLLAERGLKTQHVVEMAWGGLKNFQERQEEGELTKQQARTTALAAVRALRYDEKEYFWINDMHPRMGMHPYKPELEGTDLSGTRDKAGKSLIVEFVEVVWRNLLINTGVLLVMGLVSWFLSRWIVRPLHLTADAIECVKGQVIREREAA